MIVDSVDGRGGDLQSSPPLKKNRRNIHKKCGKGVQSATKNAVLLSCICVCTQAKLPCL